VRVSAGEQHSLSTVSALLAAARVLARGTAPCTAKPGGTDAYLVHHIHREAFLDGPTTEQRDHGGELVWDEPQGDDIKLLGVFSTETGALQPVEHARAQSGFHDEPDCFLVSAHIVDEETWTDGYVTERA
jgi:hypothetical protein